MSRNVSSISITNAEKLTNLKNKNKTNKKERVWQAQNIKAKTSRHETIADW